MADFASSVQSQVQDDDPCNLPQGCLIEELRVEAGLPDVEKTWAESVFDRTLRWNCAEDAPYWVELERSRYHGPAKRHCEAHARAAQYGVEKERLAVVRIWDRRTGQSVQLASHLIHEDPI